MQAPKPPRAGMPFTGIATFARAPYVPPEALQPGQADFAVIGVPFDAAVGFRPGQRLAPRAIRDLSTRYALPWGPDNPGYWDIQDDRWYLKGCRLVDLGDADPLYTDLEHLDRSVAAMVGAALRAGAVPVVLGGDHSITFPVLKAYGELLQAVDGPGPVQAVAGPGLVQAVAGPGPAARSGGYGGGRVSGQESGEGSSQGTGHASSRGSGGGRLHILQIDAHLDFSADVAGFLRSNSSPFRRAAELPFIGSITVIGVRGIRTSPEAYAAAVRRGNRIVTMREWRQAWATARSATPTAARMAGVGAHGGSPGGGGPGGAAVGDEPPVRRGGAGGDGEAVGESRGRRDGGLGRGRARPRAGGPDWRAVPEGCFPEGAAMPDAGLEQEAAQDPADFLGEFFSAIPPGAPLYISLDIDGLDPAVAPGTSSPEPGGLSYEEVREILRRAAARGRIVGIDVVEVNPYLDPGGVTALLAARLAIEAMALGFGQNPLGSV
ncbi:arginase family protein [Thermaerobacter litoralis]